jgi:hypothetical protein
MKKIILTAFLVLAVALVSAQDLAAQTDLTWNFGVVTDKSFKFDPFLWTTGFTVDVYMGPRFSLSPEVYMVIHNFDFGAFILAPALLLNYQTYGFFIGGGITKWWALGSQVEGAPSSDVMAKFNIGLVGSDIKLTLFAVTPFQNFFQNAWYGVTIGFYF